MDAIRAEAPNTIVILTADDGGGWMPIPMPARHHSAVRKGLHLKVAGVSRPSCGGPTTSRRVRSMAK